MWEKWKSYLSVLAGAAVAAAATAFFLLPYSLVAGGVSGLALLLEGILSPLGISAEALIPPITWSLFLLGWLTLGQNFAAKTFLFSLSYPLFLSALLSLYGEGGPPLLTGNGVSGGFFAALAGGAVLGTGCAMSFHGGGSTGGLDVLALLLCRRIHRLSPPRAIFLMDALICLAGLILFRRPIQSLQGVLCATAGGVLFEFLYSAPQNLKE